jgi:hypothetical protein
MSAETVARNPFDLITLWRNDAAEIDDGTKPGSHLKAIALRICAQQLESVCGDDLPGSTDPIIDTSAHAGLSELSQCLIGTIITNCPLPFQRAQTIAWVLQFDPVDGLPYWQGTHRNGVSLTTDQLARDHGPLFERIR